MKFRIMTKGGSYYPQYGLHEGLYWYFLDNQPDDQMPELMICHPPRYRTIHEARERLKELMEVPMYQDYP